MADNKRDFELIEIAKRCLDGRDKISDHWHKIEEENIELMYIEKIRHTKAEFKISPKSKADLVKLIDSRKWKVVLGNLRSFVELYQYCTSVKTVTELGVSSTTDQLKQLFGSQKNVSNVIDYAEKVGLLKCVDPRWHFSNKKTMKSKRYIYSKDVEKLIKKVADEEKISYKLYVKKNDGVSNADKLVQSVDEKVRDRIRVGSGLGIRVDKYNLTNNQIRAVLDKRYPMVAECRDLANEDNVKLNGREQIKCEWNITYSKSGKSVERIGFRATSGIVSFKKKSRMNPDPSKEKYSGIWREDYLDQELGVGWQEFDVKSSIFRVTFFLNYGIWLDNKIDLYKLMYGSDFRDDDERTAYKVLKMRTYFDTGKKVAGHIMPVFRGSECEAVKSLIDLDKSREELVVGESRGSEVFVYESCIYMKFVHRLRDKGMKVIQVYDGFYFKSDEKDIRVKLENELRDVVEEFRMKYLKKLNKNHIKENEIRDLINQIKENHNKNIINNRTIRIDNDLPDYVRDNSDIPDFD